MAAPIRVGIIGATGQTGKSIVNGLLASPTTFEITGFTRKSSLNNAANDAQRAQGVKVVAFDMHGTKDSHVAAFKGLDVVISCVHGSQIADQVKLIPALKEVGIKRFVPCDFATPGPRGSMSYHDVKYKVLDAIQLAYLPYTVIDDGWWYSGIQPEVPSGKTNHAIIDGFNDKFVGDGNVPIALIDTADIGIYVAKIIADPRTINKKVLAYTEVLTLNEVWALMSEVAGEKAIKETLTAEDLTARIEAGKKLSETDPLMSFLEVTINEYFYSWAIRGDNNPDAAKYLGYLDCKDLYPDLKATSMKNHFQKMIDSSPAEPTGKLAIAEFIKTIGF